MHGGTIIVIKERKKIMTIETLQSEMIAAMKSGNKNRKTAISGYLSLIHI